jgi:glycerophosphoryl diester phosphodiesterase
MEKTHPIFIAHRGNLYGPNKVQENRLETIIHAIENGYDCEIDIWYLEKNGFYLGHDFPMYSVEFAFLENYKNYLWIHCKNLNALVYLKNFGFNCFFHDRDHYTITSKGIIWGNINSPMASDVICVMPELSHTLSFDVFGICTDFPVHFKELYLAR